MQYIILSALHTALYYFRNSMGAWKSEKMKRMKSQSFF